MRNKILAIAALLVAAGGILAASPAIANHGGSSGRGSIAERHWVGSRGFRSGHHGSRGGFVSVHGVRHRGGGHRHWVHGGRLRHRPFPHHAFPHHGFRRPKHPFHSGAVIFFGPPAVVGHREGWGAVIGGAAGGLLGAGIGRGAGNTAAIIGGAVLGTVVGGSVGRSMDDVDRLRVARTLETFPSRRVAVWQNPDSGNRYEVEPLVTFSARDGRYCREFQTSATIAGALQRVYGTACRQPDGSWEVVP